MAEAADLILYGELTVDGFFDEAQRLGVPTEALRESATYNRVLSSCLARVRAQTALEVAGGLNLPLSAEQAEKIARHSLVPSVSLEPVALTPEEAQLAEELYYHAVKGAMARHGEAVPDDKARKTARRLVRDGQLGPTWWRRLVPRLGCLSSLILMTLSGAAALVGMLFGAS